MATSGTYVFSQTATEIISAALRAAKAIATEETPTAAQSEDARVALNMILKECQAQGMFLWTVEDITLYLAHDTASYLIGPKGTNCSVTTVETEVATAASSGASTIAVDSITGMSDGDYVGIQLDDGTMQWTTINGAPAAATITLTAALTDDVAVDNIVVTYTTKAQRPVEITQVLVRDHSGNDVELLPISRSEWAALSSKTSAGKPVQYYYDPLLTDGKLYLWPRPTDVEDRIIITSRRPIQTIEDITDDFEVPQDWFRFLKWELAAEIAADYEIDLQTLAWLQSKADRSRAIVDAFDIDKGSFFIQPVTR
jgi:predicted lipoprotein with Yx(FWY)xxD motif